MIRSTSPDAMSSRWGAASGGQPGSAAGSGAGVLSGVPTRSAQNGREARPPAVRSGRRRTTRARRARSVIAVSAVASSSSGSTVVAWSISASARPGRWGGLGAAVGRGSTTTRSPGSLNEVTILARSAVGHGVSGSMGVGPQAQTVAGVGAVKAVRGRVGVLVRRVARRLVAVRAGALG